ncbi:hypothetical protein H5410_025254 [Solanum commersonii]|uniref:Uncharacterized protein n=1 Tax=Solanum commersonii TaxID=4109 RepID=A0A9J5YTS0_SOLCO|nr:hypothetical protein H5410_025254 [Solanum commersonii]
MLLVGLKRILTVGLRWMVDLPKVWGHGGDVENVPSLFGPNENNEIISDGLVENDSKSGYRIVIWYISLNNFGHTVVIWDFLAQFSTYQAFSPSFLLKAH